MADVMHTCGRTGFNIENGSKQGNRKRVSPDV